MSDWTIAHAQELERSKSPAYGLLTSLQARSADERIDALRRECVMFVDRVVAEELPFDMRVLAGAERLLRLESADAVECMRAWNALLSAPHAKRRPLRTALQRFPEWIDAAADARAEFVRVVVAAAPAFNRGAALDLGKLAVELRSAPADLRPAIASFCEIYAGADSRSFQSLLAIARRTLQIGREELLQALRDAVTPAQLSDESEGPALLGALERLSAQNLTDAVWSAALELSIVLASRNMSSAFVFARDLPDRLARLPPDAHAAYLADFTALVRSVGIRIVGFGLSKLPSMYLRRGSEATRRFVADAVKVAERYGIAAASAFCDGDTTAARGAASG